MQKYKSNITTTSGAAVRGVPVLVIDEDGNNAALFLDRAGTVQAPNPLTTGPDGVFYFYAVNGRYSLRTTVDGATITDDDVVLMMDPEEITVAGPIAEAVAAAQAAAIAAEFAVEASGIPDLFAAAQNAVVDANNAVTQATSAANNAAISKTGADSARDDAVIAKNAAEAALDSFDDRYLGAKAVEPATDNDGGALLTGALYWDTALPGMRSWNGTEWVTLPAATAAAISNTPAGSIAATTVQAAINELDAEKVAASVTLPENTDLNTVVKSGFYRLSVVVNGPPGDISYGQMIVSRGLDTISQIAFGFVSGIVYTRGGSPTDVGGVGVWTSWRVLLDSSNYNGYSPTLTGVGASGTWPISVTGSAPTLTTARTINGVSFNGSANISIAASAVPSTPAGSIAATTVQAAINELDTEKVSLTGDQTIAGTKTFSSFPVLPMPGDLFRKADSSTVVFTKTGAGTAQIKAGTLIDVGGTTITFAAATAITMPALTAGTDYAIYACTDGTVRADASFSVPSGYTTANSRKIGGFHYAPGGNAPAQAGGDTTPAINAYSFWDLKFKPSCPDPRGMTLVANGFWADIYLTGLDHYTNGTSKYNVTIADGYSPPKVPALFGGNGSTAYTTYTWWEAGEVLRSHGKRLPTYDEFAALAYGTTEASSGGTDPVSTILRAAYTSRFGVMLATGNLWQWGADFGGGAGTAAWAGNTGGRGSTYQLENAAFFGGSWGASSNAGSRCSLWSNSPTISSSDVGSRAVCDLLILE